MVPGSEALTERVEAVIGELSNFHDTFGYYAQGVDQTTSTLPNGWENRLIEVCNENTNGFSGLCLEIHDLVISKIHAGREKDFEFVESVAKLGLISEQVLKERIEVTAIPETLKTDLNDKIERIFSL